MAGEVVFRKAEAADLPAIVALLADDELGRQREDARLPLAAAYQNAFQSVEADPNQLLVVAWQGTEMVGTLQISFIPSIARKGIWRGQIEAVRISKSHRGTGLGKQLFEWAIDQCRRRGCGLVQLTSDKSRPDAHRFYESLGFTASHVGYKMSI